VKQKFGFINSFDTGTDPGKMVTVFSIIEAAKVQPSNVGGLGTCYPGKRFGILIL